MNLSLFFIYHCYSYRSMVCILLIIWSPSRQHVKVSKFYIIILYSYIHRILALININVKWSIRNSSGCKLTTGGRRAWNAKIWIHIRRTRDRLFTTSFLQVPVHSQYIFLFILWITIQISDVGWELFLSG